MRIPDLAVANGGSNSNNVTILLGNGTGGFTASTNSPFAVGKQPESVVAGDFNGDGSQDLAVANINDNTVTVLLGNGQGGFAAAQGSPFAVGHQPASIGVGDFNGDGIQDLAVGNFKDSTVTVLLGNGAGGFTAASGGPLAVGTNPGAVAVADFNGDGFLDLATANYANNATGGGNITVFFGNGSGGFTAAPGSPFAAGTGTFSMAVGDFNGDGNPDLAAAGYTSNNITVLLGSVSGAFTAATGNPIAVGTNPQSLVVGDFTGNGIQDLAVANSGANNVTILLGNGSGGFTASAGSPYAGGNKPRFARGRGL